jgi:cysteinyl-tRNA synthetase
MLSDSNENDADRYCTALHFDSVLSLGLADYVTPLPEEIMTLIKDRDLARKDKNWTLSDSLRDKLAEKGYLVMDGPNGTEVEKL